jgi:hypothetical protein
LRDNALKFLREIAGSPDGDSLNSLVLVPTSCDKIPNNYQIEIKSKFAYHTIRDLDLLLEKYGLTIKEEKDRIIIN